MRGAQSKGRDFAERGHGCQGRNRSESASCYHGYRAPVPFARRPHVGAFIRSGLRALRSAACRIWVAGRAQLLAISRFASCAWAPRLSLFWTPTTYSRCVGSHRRRCARRAMCWFRGVELQWTGSFLGVQPDSRPEERSRKEGVDFGETSMSLEAVPNRAATLVLLSLSRRQEKEGCAVRRNLKPPRESPIGGRPQGGGIGYAVFDARLDLRQVLYRNASSLPQFRRNEDLGRGDGVQAA